MRFDEVSRLPDHLLLVMTTSCCAPTHEPRLNARRNARGCLAWRPACQLLRRRRFSRSSDHSEPMNYAPDLARSTLRHVGLFELRNRFPQFRYVVVGSLHQERQPFAADRSIVLFGSGFFSAS